MAKRKNPSTSNEAYRAVSIQMLNTHYSKILSALQKLGSGTFEEIGDYIGLEKHKIGRRLKELEGLKIICKPGNKKPTKSGRMAYCYQLTNSSQPKTEIQEAAMKGKAVVDYSREILKNKLPRQETLFD